MRQGKERDGFKHMNHMSIRTVDVSDQPLEGAPSQPQKESAPNLNISTAQKFHIRCVLVVPGNWKGLGGGTKGTFSFSFSTFLALEEALGPSSSRFRGGITWHFAPGSFKKVQVLCTLW